MKQLLVLILICLSSTVCGFGQVNDNSIFMEVKNLRAENKCDAAIILLSKGIITEPKNANLYLERASCFRELKNNEAILSDVQTAFRLNPNDKVLLQAGEFELRASGQSKELVKIADSIIANDENNATAYLIRSLNKEVLKDFVGAIDDYLKFNELEPTPEYGRIGIIFGSLKGFRTYAVERLFDKNKE